MIRRWLDRHAVGVDRVGTRLSERDETRRETEHDADEFAPGEGELWDRSGKWYRNRTLRLLAKVGLLWALCWVVAVVAGMKIAGGG